MKPIFSFYKIVFILFLLGFVKANAQLIINSFNPTSGPVGTSVIINGTNFNTVLANNIVYFGAVKAAVTSATTNSLTVIAPAGASYQPITILNSTTGLIGYSSKPFIITFVNPFGTGILANFYRAKIDINTGTNPRNVSIYDLDGDSKTDLIINDQNSASTISVMRNLSSSTNITSSFATKVDYTIGGYPYIFTVADVDGDGKLDLITANQGLRTISILRNTSTMGNIGILSFSSKVDFAVTGENFSIAVRDLDGDGKPEIIVTNTSNDIGINTVSILRNTSVPGNINASSFAPKIDFATASDPRYVAIGDIDGDGKPDLIVANLSGSISVLRNTSTPGSINTSSFATKVDFLTGNLSYSVAVGDLDGDSKPEVVVANGGSNTLSVFRNTSITGNINASSFAAKVDFATGVLPHSVAIGDLDGDGKPELVVTNITSNNISVYRNVAILGTINLSSFLPKVDFTTITSPSFSSDIAIDDLDGDGIPEIAVANSGSNTISIFQIAIFPTTITLASSLNPAIVGQSITFTATLTASGSPTGTVTFYDSTSNTSLGTVQLAGNTVAVSTSALTTGSHNITATYNGSAGYAASTSVILLQVIQPALTPAIVIYPNPVKNGSIQLHFINMPAGNYFVKLVNSLGQTIVSRQINYAGGTGIQTITVNKSGGAYLLQITKPDGSRQDNKVVIN